MVRRVSHRRAAANEAKRAALDAASLAFPKLGEARHIMGVVKHGGNAAYHAKKAAQKVVNSRINKVKRNIRKIF